MGLRIQNNMAAMNAHRQLSISDTNLSKSLQRLSSGYRINRASDDAAGLAIAAGFRADIASFKTASRNASEASAMLQVAEGAADQISAMLVRLKELATQASSANAGSNLTKINAEKTKLLAEINKIANSTEYADTALIDGTYGVGNAGTGANLVAANGFESLSGMKQSYSYAVNVVDTAGSNIADITITAFNSSGTTVGSETIYDTSIPASAGSTQAITFSAIGVDLTVNSNLTEALGAGAADLITASNAGSSTFQLGAENNSTNQINISLDGLTTATGDLNIATIDLSTQSGAQTAMTSIDNAIGTLNTVRGDIGATSNQIMYHTANLASTIENVQAAESVIRDVDMAAEMTNFTKNQILLQAGTAMLAQANMAPQQVLALFG